MDMDKKDIDLQIGNRLRESRRNLNKDRMEFAESLEVTEDHYRKIEAGRTSLSADKMFLLYKKYGIDPTYLITGRSSVSTGFDLDYFVANSSKEQRDIFIERVLQYVVRIIK